jgi:hypothetical protein
MRIIETASAEVRSPTKVAFFSELAMSLHYSVDPINLYFYLFSDRLHVSVYQATTKYTHNHVIHKILSTENSNWYVNS